MKHCGSIAGYFPNRSAVVGPNHHSASFYTTTTQAVSTTTHKRVKHAEMLCLMQSDNILASLTTTQIILGRTLHTCTCRYTRVGLIPRQLTNWLGSWHGNEACTSIRNVYNRHLNTCNGTCPTCIHLYIRPMISQSVGQMFESIFMQEA